MCGECNFVFVGGDSGLFWEGISGYLYFMDKLTDDFTNGFVYLCVFEKFMGDLLSKNVYGVLIMYLLYMVELVVNFVVNVGIVYVEVY